MKAFAEFYVLVALALSGLAGISAWAGYRLGSRGTIAAITSLLNEQASNYAKSLKEIHALKALGAFDQGAEVMRAELTKAVLAQKSAVRHYDDVVELIATHKLPTTRAWGDEQPTANAKNAGALGEV